MKRLTIKDIAKEFSVSISTVSKALNDSSDPCIIISSSGMMNAGRVKHHLYNNIEDPKERAFSGFIRILHGAATGNPQVALGLWVKSLYLDKNENVIACLPRLPTSDVLENASLTVLLVLRVICQSEVITKQDIVKSLQIHKQEVEGAIQLSVFNRWVDIIDDDYYQLSWYWRKVVMKVLARQNLMPRSYG